MQLAHRITIASLVVLAIVGCDGSPEDAAARVPTLRYLGTRRVLATPETPVAEPGYEDVLELSNATSTTFKRFDWEPFDALGPESLASIKVYTSDDGWIETGTKPDCFVGCAFQLIPPGESVTIRMPSWLRRTRVTIPVSPEGTGPFAADWWANCSDEFDSSLAAPNTRPPMLPGRSGSVVDK